MNSGANKPLFTYYGDRAVEVSGWESEVSVDGSSKSLWRHAFGQSRQDGTVYWNGADPEYELRQTSVSDDGASLRYVLRPESGSEISPVTVNIAHYRWYVDEVDVGAETVVYEYTDEGVECSSSVEIVGDHVNVAVHEDEDGRGNYFTVSASASSLEPNCESVILVERITFDRGYASSILASRGRVYRTV